MERRTLLLGETLLFGLLGRLFYENPNKEWLQSLIAEDVFDDVPYGEAQEEMTLGLNILKKWAGQHKSGLSDEAFDDIRADNTRMFVGVKIVLAPLWESVHFSEARLVFQERTLEVRNWYRRFGLEPEKLHKEPDDHIGLEMLFVSHLAGLALQALEDQEEEKVTQLLEAQRQFLSEHLLQWGPTWALLVIEHAKTDFYLGLGHVALGAFYAIADQYDIQVALKEDR